MVEFSREKSIARIVALLNSTGVGYDAGRDLLTQRSHFGEFARSTGYVSPATLGKKGLADLRALRAALLAMINGTREATMVFDDINRVAIGYGFHYRFDSDGNGAAEGYEPSVVSEVLADIVDIGAAGVWDRVKLCANPSCGAVFFDPTRAKTRKWHSFDMCGNRMNVAAFRRRAASGEAE